MIQFDVPADVREFLGRLEEFIASTVVPLEKQYGEAAFLDGSLQKETLPGLRQAARRAGVYGPQLPPELGGQDLGTTALALISERCGPYPLASLALNMMAPDEATMHLLLHFGSPRQREQWLGPLAAGGHPLVLRYDGARCRV